MVSDNSQQNQQLDPDLQLNLPKKRKEETNPFMLAIKEPAVESKIQKLLNINAKIWYELKDKGVLPQNGTYGEYISAVFTHYRNRNRSKDTGDDSSLSKVIEVEKIQKIRLDRAKEQEVHLRNLATRMELINKQELYDLIMPLMMNISNILRAAADEDPKVQPIIDKCFVNLSTIGKRLLEQSGYDKENYVEEMLNTPLDLEDIMEQSKEAVEKASALRKNDV